MPISREKRPSGVVALVVADVDATKRSYRRIMNSERSPIGQTIRRLFSKIGSAILMFQKVPVHQVIAQEARFIGTGGVTQLMKWSVATISGLGAYDSVSGATQIKQIAPVPNSSTVPATTGELLHFAYQMTGADGDNSRPSSWSISGTLPAGLVHNDSTNNHIDYISGIPTESGSFQVRVKGWEDPNYRGDSKSETFTIVVVQGVVAPAITTQPQSTKVEAGTAVTLSVVATGSPLSYQWYRGSAPDDSDPISQATTSSYTTPALGAATSYWVQVSNSGGVDDSITAMIEVTDTFASWSSTHFNAEQLGDPLISGAGADPDSDHTTNEEEFIWGTDPLAADGGRTPSIAASAAQIFLSFTADAASGPGYSGLTRHYALEACDDLSCGIWTAIPGYSDIVGTGQFVEANPAAALGSTYYRLRASLSVN